MVWWGRRNVVSNHSRSLLAALLLVMSLPLAGVAVADEAPPPIVIAAGVPRNLGDTRDYDRIFAELASAGVTVFLPTSQYQELPVSLSIGYEIDFLPPCTPESPAFAAMRRHGIRLLVPGQLLFAAELMLPEGQDPLKALIECVGEAAVFAVLSIDEPVNAPHDPADPVAGVRTLYERVKAVAPELPVMMVHAPLPSEVIEADGSVRVTTQAEVDAYLEQVIVFSAYADIIGFDVYPIPPSVGAVIAPGLGLRRVSYEEAIPAYVRWLTEAANGRSIFMTLQGFSYERLLDAATAQEAREAGFDLRFPTESELRDMACLTVAGGGIVAWWGQSHLIEEDVDFWASVLTVSRSITRDAGTYCR